MSHFHCSSVEDEPTHAQDESPECALLRRMSDQSSVNESRRMQMSSIYPPQLSFGVSTRTHLPAHLPLAATANMGGGYGVEPFSSTLDEYYMNQDKIHQVYANNAAIAAASSASILPTSSLHNGIDMSSIPSSLSLIRGLPIDLHHTQHVGPMNFHYNNAAKTDVALDHINTAATSASYAATGQQHLQNQQFYLPINPSRRALALPSDSNFLSEAHCFIRSVCVELFTVTDHHARNIGQVGFRCIHCKNKPREHQADHAVAFPSTRDSIFEAVQDFQRVHMEACPFIPLEIKFTFQDIIQRGDHTHQRSQKLVRAYYAVAASEMGLIDTPYGLRYKDEHGYNQRATSSRQMLNVMEAADAEDDVKAASVEEISSPKDDNPMSVANDVKFGKFDSLSSKLTKQVILNAQREPSVFVQPQDFPIISDFVFLLFHQLKPCKPTFTKKRRRVCSSSTLGEPSVDRELSISSDSNVPLTGLCCKHCQNGDNETSSGMYFPSNVECLGDSSFSQTFFVHLMNNCDHVPQDVKHALTELKNLAKEYKASVKRGGKKMFVAKVWERLESYTKKAT